MSNPKDKTIVWQGAIQERAAHATKTILDRLATMPKSGVTNLTPAERRDIHEVVAKSIVDTMATLGTFVTAGAQDFQVCELEGVTISKGKVAMKLIPQTTESGGINLQMLAANAGKQVVVAMINALAYGQAREALSKAITREQTDWVQRSQADEVEAEQAKQHDDTPTPPVQQEAGDAAPQEENQQPGELIAEQPGDGNAETSEGGASQQEPAEAETGASEGGDATGGGPIAGPAEESGDDQPPERPAENRDSPLARAGRRVRRSTGNQPATH